MSVYKGDFLGFQFGDTHSYNLNITRVSSNDRYTEILTPNFTDQTTQVPGGNGTYYWDSNYTQKQIQVDFAFDNMTDEDIKNLKIMFGQKGIHPLIFDEHKDRKYMVKIAQPPSINYIGFRQKLTDEEIANGDYQNTGDGDEVDPYKIIYKGEGSVQFVAYYPFAIGTPSIVITSGSTTNNIGEMPAYPNFLYYSGYITSTTRVMQCVQNGQTVGQLSVQGLELQSQSDYWIYVNSKAQLIEGYTYGGQRTGNVYNQFINAGDFFTVPVGQSTVTCTGTYWAGYDPLYY